MLEKILSLIKSHGPLSFNEIKKDLNVKSARSLDNWLRELIFQNKIFYKKSLKKYFFKNGEIVIGTFKDTRQTFGFVELENGQSIFIPEKFTQNSLNGDSVKALLFPLREGDDSQKRSGKILQILKRSGNNILGKIYIENKKVMFLPNESFSKYEYKLKELPFKVNNDDVIVAKFVDFREKIIYLKPIEILGNIRDAKIDHLIVTKQYNLNSNFSHNVKEEATKINENISIDNRKVILNSLIVTIDGKTSKDLDDAIQVLKLKNGNYKLLVHIADVAHYVKENSEIDKEAFERGTSIYLIDKVIPMLPKILSNNLASLNPDTKKYVLSVEMEINLKGDVINYDVYESVISSKYQLTYEEVDQLFLDKIKTLRNDNELTDMLLNANELAKIIRSKKMQEGMIDFIMPEIKIELNNEGEPISIFSKKQTISEKMIEDLMVITNQTVAKLFKKNKQLGIFRVHPMPKFDNLEKFVELAKTFSEFLNKRPQIIKSNDLALFIEKINNKPYESILKKYLIQSMEKAIYSTSNDGHYALGLDDYLHFTSPIRRYPDLIIHRILKKFYFKSNKTNIEIRDDYLIDAAKSLSRKEKEAMVVERKLEDIKKVRFIEKKVGNSFEGIISAVTSFGFFVDLEYQIQGLIRIEDLKDDEYYYNDAKFSIIGKTRKKIFKLGNKTKVKIIGVDILKGIVNLSLISENNS